MTQILELKISWNNMLKNKKPLVVIFGRTNVGKSTLFNCLVEKNQALISNIEGTTRDSNINTVEWNNMKFKLIDTGGILDIPALLKKTKKINTDIDIKVQDKAREYLKQADLILFLVDVRDGLLPQDKEMALALKKIILKTNKIILTANKADSPSLIKQTAEFNKLSLGEPIPISAITGSGTGDLLDVIIKELKKLKYKTEKKLKKLEEKKQEKKEKIIQVNIIGKPNVGKSSLVNSILGEDRIIVSPIPHTTREPQDTEIKYKEKIINLIDTAGISKQGMKKGKIGGKNKAKLPLEKLSIEKSLNRLQRADVAILLIDISKRITHQDAKLIEEIVATKTSFVIVANKWDLIEDKDTKHFTQEIYRKFPFCKWAPVLFVSALTGSKVDKVLDLVIKVAEARETEISANALSKFLNRIVKKHKPAKAKGTKHPHIFELRQDYSNPPCFTVRIGTKDTIHFSYLKFIENRLREKFGFLGTPLRMCIEKNKKIHGKKEEN